MACRNGIFEHNADAKSLQNRINVNDHLHDLKSEDNHIHFIQNSEEIRSCHPLAFQGLGKRFYACCLDKSDAVYDRLAVRKHIVAVKERDIGTVLIKRSRKPSKKYAISGSPIYHLSFHTDESLLVTSNDANTLTKYKSRSWKHGDGEEEWVLNKLNGAAGLCIDGHGQIFVSSNVKKVIYVVSPTGK